MSNHLLVQLQRQHILLSYFKTLSVGPVWDTNPRPPAQQTGALPTELTRPSKDSWCHLQETLARALHEEARLPIGPCGLDQIKLFEIILDEHQFIVISAEHGHSIVHKGPQSNKQIKLSMHDGHFDVITKFPRFFNSNYYCLRCEKAYKQEDYDHH